MSGPERGMAADRERWLLSLRRTNEVQEDELDPTFDEEWGEISETHRRYVEVLLVVAASGRHGARRRLRHG